MAESKLKVENESNDTSAGEQVLDFEEATSIGEKTYDC